MAAELTRLTPPPAMADETILDAARECADAMADAELGLIVAALEWAHANPGWFLISLREQTTSPGTEDLAKWEQLASEGCAFVDDMSIPEFSYASGQSEMAARSLVMDAVVMYYRFPRTWARMVAGGVRVWRARLVARYGKGAPAKVAAYVDRHLDRPGARFTRPQVQRLFDEASLRFTPDQVQAENTEGAERRGVDVDAASVSHLGLGDVAATLELSDALDLEAALRHGAKMLKEAGSTETLDVRRAHALGDLARAAQVPGHDVAADPNRPHWDGKGVARTGVKIYIHLNHTALKCTCDGATVAPAPTTRSTGSPIEYMIRGPGPPPGPGVVPQGYGTFLLPDLEREDDRLGEAARVSGTGMPTGVLDPQVIRRWLSRPTTVGPQIGPKITVTHVRDPDQLLSTEAYEVPERLRDRITATHSRTCVFPFCQAESSRSDCDHITPFLKGGPTCECNLAPLCRFHHRVKTHGQREHVDHRWTYAPLGKGSFVWSGPNGIHLLRDPVGTHVVAGDVFTHRPLDGRVTPDVRRPNGTRTAFDASHPAFRIFSEPSILPESDTNGEPVPVDMDTLRRQATIRNIQDPNAGTPIEDRMRGTSGIWVGYQERVEENRRLIRNQIRVDEESDDTPWGDEGPPPF